MHTLESAGPATKNSAAATLSYYDYTYNAGNLVTSQTHWSQVGTTTYSGTNTYSYDKDNELLRDGTTTYSYGPNGNRKMTGYQTTAANEVVSDGTYSYAYDAEGNQTLKTTGTGTTWTYSYDNENEMTGAVEVVSGTTQAVLTYSYDAEGHRVGEQVWTSTTATVTTTRYANDGDNVWADLDGTNTLLVRYQYGDGPDQILTRTVARSGGGTVTAYLTDNEGSARDLVNGSGQVIDHLDYSGIGVLTLESNPSVGDGFKYDGYQFEALTGLYYVNARWYNPSTGDWTTQDPEGFAAGDSNLYRYVGNDPTENTDPSGLVTIPGPGGPGTAGCLGTPAAIPQLTIVGRSKAEIVKASRLFAAGQLPFLAETFRRARDVQVAGEKFADLPVDDVFAGFLVTQNTITQTGEAFYIDNIGPGALPKVRKNPVFIPQNRRSPRSGIIPSAPYEGADLTAIDTFLKAHKATTSATVTQSLTRTRNPKTGKIDVTGRPPPVGLANVFDY
jgi:RHS repeat-associated protein